MKAFLREPGLSVASHGDVSRELKLLVDRREDLVARRTSTINRLLWRVDELDPERAPKPRSLDLAKHRTLLGRWLATRPGLVAELACDELADITRLTDTINALAKRIEDRVRQVTPGAGGSSWLRGTDRRQTRRRGPAGVTRFKNEPVFARHARVAPSRCGRATPPGGCA